MIRCCSVSPTACSIFEPATSLPMSPDVLVSKRCNVAYDPGATCPRFVQFLKEVQPDKEMAYFLLRLMGYCLTGRCQQAGLRVLLWPWGERQERLHRTHGLATWRLRPQNPY